MKRAQRNPLLHAARQRMRPHLESLHIYWRGLHLLVASAPLPAAAYLALLVLFSSVPVMQVWLLKRLVDVLSAPLHLAGGQDGMFDNGLLIVLAALYLLTIVIPGGLQPFYDNLEAITKERVIIQVDRRIMQASARLVDLGRVEAPSFHDEVKLIRQSSYEVPQMLGMLSLGPGTMLTLGGLLLLLAQIHPVLPLLLLLVGIPGVRARHRMETEKYRSLAEHSRVASEMEYYTRLALEPAVAHEVRVFGLGDFLLRRYRQRRDGVMAEVQRLRLREFGQALAYSGITTLVLAGAFSYTALQASAGHLQVGDIALYLGAVVQATREALVNAAKHAGVETISLYAEVEPTEVTVFVRDRGAGFDPAAVPEDRHGIAPRGGANRRLRASKSGAAQPGRIDGAPPVAGRHPRGARDRRRGRRSRADPQGDAGQARQFLRQRG